MTRYETAEKMETLQRNNGNEELICSCHRILEFFWGTPTDEFEYLNRKERASIRWAMETLLELGIDAPAYDHFKLVK